MSLSSPRIFFSVGEPSGDQHTARLIEAISQLNPDCQFRGFGGPEMEAVDCRLDYELTSMAVVGIVEVLPKIRQFRRIAALASEIFARTRPDAVVLADFPGFNWHIAKRARREGIPVYYYLPPQLWAWASWRISKVRKYVDHVLSVLPFEHDWYCEHGVDSTFVGHPFFDAVADKSLDTRILRQLTADDRTNATGGAAHPLVAVLPGSRWHEVQRNWPTMLAAVRRLHEEFPHARFAVANFRDAHCLWCRDQLVPADHQLPLDFYVGKTSEIIEAAHSAMMVSGSVSLELMARGTPAAVLYQTSRVTYAVGKALVRVPSITLPNLIAGETIFPELATAGAPEQSVDFLVNSLSKMLGDHTYHQSICDRLTELRLRYAAPGASHRAAEVILQGLGIATQSDTFGQLPAKAAA